MFFWKRLAVIMLPWILLCSIWNVSIANTFDLQPVYLGAVGRYAPLTLYPIAVAVGPNNVYVADIFQKKIQVRGQGGVLVRTFPLLDTWTRDMDIDIAGNLYTADSSKGKIRKYAPDGTLLLEFGALGNLPGQFKYLQTITVKDNGIIYAADSATNLSAFDRNGLLIWNNKSTVAASGAVRDPQGMALDANGNIYVADAGLSKVLVFDQSGVFLRSIGPRGNGWALQSPVGVTVAADGTIFVLVRLQQSFQIGQHQILKFTNAGEFIGSWAAKGRGPGELWEAQGLTLGPDGNVWVAGYQGHNIVRYDQSGNLIEEWNDHNNIQPYKFASVRGATVNSHGIMYVTDFWNQVVQVFDRYGNFLSKWGERGQGNGQYFNFPRFTAVNGANQIYISDDREIRVFNEDGTFVGRSDWIIFPGGIDVDSLGNVWVTGMGENSVRKYTSALGLVQKFTGTGIPLGLNSPYGIRQGPNGSLYVADTMNHRIVRMSTDGNFELAFGRYGVGPGQFGAPVGLAVDSKGHLFVSETWNHRIQVFSPDGNYLASWNVPGQPEKNTATVYELTMDGDYFLYAPDHTKGQAEVHKYALVPKVATSGKPVYTAGNKLGYYIWSDDGATWHLRWSADGVAHTFSGVVTSTTPITGSTAVGLEVGDKVSPISATRIDFNTYDVIGEDGVDILIGSAGIITFDLKVDGVEQAGLVAVGAGAFSPATLPLPLRTANATITSGGFVNAATIGMPSYVPARNGGYFLWQDQNDGEWHLRWSGDSVTTFHYEGIIASTLPITNVRKYSYEANDSLGITPLELSFNGYAGAGEDGIDFFVPEGAKVSFRLLTGGSGSVGNINIGRAGVKPAAVPFTLLSALTSISPSGLPAYIPAKNAGYYLWKDTANGQWHLRWSGDSVKTYLFEGTILSSGGILTYAKNSFEANDRVSVIPSGLSFSGYAGAGEDGLDFTVPVGHQLIFDIRVDGVPQLPLTHIGSLGTTPSTVPFSLYSP